MKKKTNTRTKPSTLLGAEYPYHPKVGERVRFRPWSIIGGKGSAEGVPCMFTRSMRHLCGTTATVTALSGRDGICLAFPAGTLETGWNYSRQMVEPAALSKAAAKRLAAEEARAKAEEAERQRLQAKKLTTEKAQLSYYLEKLDREPALKRVVMILIRDRGAFGCQRDNVLLVAASLAGAPGLVIAARVALKQADRVHELAREVEAE